MSKNRDKGNIIFFVGVFIFVVSLVVGFATDVSAVLIDICMGVGLVVEFIGLCICYKKDKNQGIEKKEEVKTLKEEKEKAKEKAQEEKIEEVVEVVKEEKKKTTTKKSNTTKKNNDTSKNNNKKSTSKKSNSKKSTTKKNNTKKNK
ncbi:MAG: hypothetical protein E7162_00635 [Firmicutes bacterium]|nr:hypothetical protein [Bacillota bacterium]